jgi:glutamate mutase epsilon subunit
MAQLSNDQKAKLYDQLIYQYQKLQEEVRQIRAKNFEVSEKDQSRIRLLEGEMRYVYSKSQRLFK